MSTLVNDYRIDTSADGRDAICYFPGFTYDDYDREGCINPWKICRMFEAGRFVSFYQGNYLNYSDLCDKNHTFYILGINYYFDSCLWEVPQRNQFFPYKIHTELIDIGQTSFTLRQLLVNVLDSKEIATCYLKCVFIDTTVKRPTALPYWHRVKYRKAESAEKVRIHTSVHTVPNNAFKSERSIAASDIDSNYHTNNASYIRFCLDTAATATWQNYFQRLTKDICLYPILKMSVAYHNETVTGDNIKIYTWQDDLSPNTLLFSISKGNTVVFTSTITFKERSLSKL